MTVAEAEKAYQVLRKSITEHNRIWKKQCDLLMGVTAELKDKSSEYSALEELVSMRIGTAERIEGLLDEIVKTLGAAAGVEFNFKD